MDGVHKKLLEKQGYRIVGKHSAIKVCLWCKRSIKAKDACYKNTFYGINSWQCIQSSVSITNCYLRCKFCWRDLSITEPEEIKDPDSPKFIVDNLIKEHVKYLQGFYGDKEINDQRMEEAIKPRHIALSLAGDATLYPLLPELIGEIHSRNMTSFLVTNGLRPDVLKKLLVTKNTPTQMYITLAAPDKETYLKTCNPLIDNAWETLQESLEILPQFPRNTIRLTLAKGINMHNPEGYAKILKPLNIKFIELKAAMPVGYAQYRVEYSSMPSHKEIKEFSEEIAKILNYKIVNEKENSRVTLLMKEDSEDRKIKF
ncbi:4-demethylwyosine synthase TYW1 [Candidatus Woesearchaeota archaeon]|nr:4-demethylwyosine synthase TYW1 [Candidatus Woesearchaeota archaeon]